MTYNCLNKTEDQQQNYEQQQQSVASITVGKIETNTKAQIMGYGLTVARHALLSGSNVKLYNHKEEIFHNIDK